MCVMNALIEQFGKLIFEDGLEVSVDLPLWPIASQQDETKYLGADNSETKLYEMAY